MAELLLCCKLRFPAASSRHSELWMQHEQVLLFRRAMLHGEHHDAQTAIRHLASLNDAEATLW